MYVVTEVLAAFAAEHSLGPLAPVLHTGGYLVVAVPTDAVRPR